MGTSTTQRGTGTTCPLHHGYRYHFLVPVPLRDFCLENIDFAIFHRFFFTKPPPIHPISKIHHGIHPIQLQRRFRINETLFLRLGLFSPKIKIIKGEVRVLFSYLSLFKSSLPSCFVMPQNPGCPLATLQPTENLYVSYRETHT